MKNVTQARDLLQYSHNWQFHDVVYRVVPQLSGRGQLSWSLKINGNGHNIKTILIQGRGENSLDEHIKILSARKQRNVDEAETPRVGILPTYVPFCGDILCFLQ